MGLGDIARNRAPLTPPTLNWVWQLVTNANCLTRRPIRLNSSSRQHRRTPPSQQGRVRAAYHHCQPEKPRSTQNSCGAHPHSGCNRRATSTTLSSPPGKGRHCVVQGHVNFPRPDPRKEGAAKDDKPITKYLDADWKPGAIAPAKLTRTPSDNSE